MSNNSIKQDIISFYQQKNENLDLFNENSKTYLTDQLMAFENKSQCINHYQNIRITNSENLCELIMIIDKINKKVFCLFYI